MKQLVLVLVGDTRLIVQHASLTHPFLTGQEAVLDSNMLSIHHG